MKVSKLIQLFSSFMVLLILLSISCDKTGSGPEPENKSGTKGLEAPGGFGYNNTRDVQIRFEARTYSGTPLQSKICNVYNAGYNDNNVLGSPIFSGLTNSAGIMEATVTIPTNLDSLFLEIVYLGMINTGMASVSSGQVTFVLGQGVIGQSGGGSNGSALSKSVYKSNTSSYAPFAFMGTWNNQGVPDYLEPNLDILSDPFLTALNDALIERTNIPGNHPEYLASGNETNVVLIDSADIWVTFVSEGAGYKNVMGYYTYPTGTPPASESDIDSITVIFPNASIVNQNQMLPGHKVYLGKFPPNTTIGWAVGANGWNGQSQTPTPGNWIVYSEPEINPVSNANLKQHMVFLKDLPSEKFIIGFEDIKRDISYCDHDFNDVVFYTTIDPISAIDDSNIPPTDPEGDCDGDGVPDPLDDYVCDPDRVIDVETPGQNFFSTLAFEDGWPSEGDYDFNDMIIDWHFKKTLNANNEVKDLVGTFILRAAGSSLQNGFALQLPVPPSVISSVNGSSMTDNYITLAGNGLEANQTNAVIIVFDNAANQMPPPEQGNLVNTEEGIPFVAPDTITISITFSTPQSQANLGNAPYNPFIIVGGERGKEVHLVDKAPTDLADGQLFGTADDASVPGSGTYYKTAANLPWALSIPASWDYPFEGKDISLAYLYFGSWLISGGSSNQDWYLNLSGYTEDSKIYKPYGISKRKR